VQDHERDEEAGRYGDEEGRVVTQPWVDKCLKETGGEQDRGANRDIFIHL